MPRSSNKRTSGREKAADTLGRAELAAEFLKRNRNYRAEHAHMEQRIARGLIARQAAEAAFARHWGCPFAYAPGDLADTVIWRPELTAVTVILDAAPDGFGNAKAVDPLKLGALLADQAGIKGRHVVVADRDGAHSLWLRDPTPGQPLAAIIPLDKDFTTRVKSLLRFHRRLFGKQSGPPARGWPLSRYRQARLAMMLQALDLRMSGASYRQIAAAMGRGDDAELPATEWKTSAGRSFVIRLVRDAAALMDGDYRKLLRIR